MPLLDDDDLKRMRSKFWICGHCDQPIQENYCRQCDEFFSYGHLKGCLSGAGQREHLDGKHRTYVETKEEA